MSTAPFDNLADSDGLGRRETGDESCVTTSASHSIANGSNMHRYTRLGMVGKLLEAGFMTKSGALCTQLCRPGIRRKGPRYFQCPIFGPKFRLPPRPEMEGKKVFHAAFNALILFSQIFLPRIFLPQILEGTKMHLSFPAYLRSQTWLDYCREEGALPPACFLFHISRPFQVPTITNDRRPLFALQVPNPSHGQDSVSLAAEYHRCFLPTSSHRAASHHPRLSSPRYSFLTPSRSITGSMTNFSATPSFQSLVCGMSYALAPHSSRHCGCIEYLAVLFKKEVMTPSILGYITNSFLEMALEKHCLRYSHPSPADSPGTYRPTLEGSLGLVCHILHWLVSSDSVKARYRHILSIQNCRPGQTHDSTTLEKVLQPPPSLRPPPRYSYSCQPTINPMATKVKGMSEAMWLTSGDALIKTRTKRMCLDHAASVCSSRWETLVIATLIVANAPVSERLVEQVCTFRPLWSPSAIPSARSGRREEKRLYHSLGTVDRSVKACLPARSGREYHTKRGYINYLLASSSASHHAPQMEHILTRHFSGWKFDGDHGGPMDQADLGDKDDTLEPGASIPIYSVDYTRNDEAGLDIIAPNSYSIPNLYAPLKLGMGDSSSLQGSRASNSVPTTTTAANRDGPGESLEGRWHSHISHWNPVLTAHFTSQLEPSPPPFPLFRHLTQGLTDDLNEWAWWSHPIRQPILACRSPAVYVSSVIPQQQIAAARCLLAAPLFATPQPLMLCYLLVIYQQSGNEDRRPTALPSVDIPRERGQEPRSSPNPRPIFVLIYFCRHSPDQAVSEPGG
ncbi:uncharacterized protein CLUP02_03814 [Colletotrichum lupini]|uniref:Uncharacterized protein n=1 Tax=Colletotrichum lupini TaxID=145971 RepID=A0A9Q8WD34_9PEZI|nr:uncharacterized protein CLUP02_03814 [Colletotrichum lupini]UQC78337.1 hypothetical protein CLUP02_03814 [Colletotrichum lupini]